MVPAAYIVENCTCVNVEHATLMASPAEFTNTIASEYRELLPTNCPLEYVEREAFHAKSRLPLTQLVIASGEQRRFANLHYLLTGWPRLKSSYPPPIRPAARSSMLVSGQRQFSHYTPCIHQPTKK